MHFSSVPLGTHQRPYGVANQLIGMLGSVHYLSLGGAGIFYGSTFNIFKTPLGQQQNLNDPPPPRETSKLM